MITIVAIIYQVLAMYQALYTYVIYSFQPPYEVDIIHLLFIEEKLRV